MGANRASFTGAGSAGAMLADALAALAAKRGGVDSPADYNLDPHPWTDTLAAAFLTRLDDALTAEPRPDEVHALAAPWRDPDRLEPGAVRLEKTFLYDLSWRIFSEDGAWMMRQPLVAETVWRGGWDALAAACDRLAQARADLKALVCNGDPGRDLGGMSTAEAAAFRIAAFAPQGEACLLAFYGPSGSWRDTAGFTLKAYVTGEGKLRAWNR